MTYYNCEIYLANSEKMGYRANYLHQRLIKGKIPRSTAVEKDLQFYEYISS